MEAADLSETLAPNYQELKKLEKHHNSEYHIVHLSGFSLICQSLPLKYK
jgi:hypothetical protein